MYLLLARVCGKKSALVDEINSFSEGVGHSHLGVYFLDCSRKGLLLLGSRIYLEELISLPRIMALLYTSVLDSLVLIRYTCRVAVSTPGQTLLSRSRKLNPFFDGSPLAEEGFSSQLKPSSVLGAIGM